MELNFILQQNNRIKFHIIPIQEIFWTTLGCHGILPTLVDVINILLLLVSTALADASSSLHRLLFRSYTSSSNSWQQVTAATDLLPFLCKMEQVGHIWPENL